MNVTCPHCRQPIAVDDRSAGSAVNCPLCNQPMTVPALPGPAVFTSAPPPGTGRPTSATVFGVLCIVFGGMALLCLPFTVFITLRVPNPMYDIPGVKAWMVFSSFLGLGAAAWQLATGIGLLRFRAWARKSAVAYGWFAIVLGIVGLIVNLTVIFPHMRESMGGGSNPAAEAGMMGGMIGGIGGGVIGMVYPILLVIFMSKQKIVEAFAKKS